MKDEYLRGVPRLQRPTDSARSTSWLPTLPAGGSVPDTTEWVGIRPSTVEAPPSRPACTLRVSPTEQLIYRGRAEGWLVVPSLDPNDRSERLSLRQGEPPPDPRASSW